jgi:hypothetical protein
VLNPRKITIVEEHIVSDGSRALHVVQKEDILIKKSRILDCLESVQVFADSDGLSVNPAERPESSANYHGSLHILSDTEESELEGELLRKGEVQRGTVEGSGNFIQ